MRAGRGGVGDRVSVLLGDKRAHGDGGRIHAVEAVTSEEMAMAAGSARPNTTTETSQPSDQDRTSDTFPRWPGLHAASLIFPVPPVPPSEQRSPVHPSSKTAAATFTAAGGIDGDRRRDSTANGELSPETLEEMENGGSKGDVPEDANAHCPGTQSEEAGKADSCAGCPNQQICATAPKGPDPDLVAIAERMATVKHKILVLSGKGGVGKSMFSASCHLP
ncbi:hypothetical protein ACQ4PT_020590 [Festuca glaucescens]